MCVSPNRIPNPNFGSKSRYGVFKDTVSRYINVPCGVCSECVRIKQLGLIQRCCLESLEGYPFFCTLTYNNESLPILSTSDGFDIRFSDCSDVVNMIKRLRKDNAFGRPFRYLCVSELGTKGRPHFHLLFFVKKFDSDNSYTPFNLESQLFPVVLKYWCRNYGSRRSPVYRPCCTYISKVVCGKLKSTYDFHYVSPSSLDGSTMDVSFYVTKYMLKPSSKAERLQSALKLNLSDEEYEDIWSKVKPRWFSSLNFGFGIYGTQPRKVSFSERLKLLENTNSFKIVRQSIDRSLVAQDTPKFYNPENGRSMPLSRYWKSFGNLFTADDFLTFYYKSNERADNVVIDDRDLSLKVLSIDKHNRNLDRISANEENFDVLFD